jgi:hypothetical protein
MSDREDSSDSNATGDNSAAGIQNIVCIAPLSARVHEVAHMYMDKMDSHSPGPSMLSPIDGDFEKEKVLS